LDVELEDISASSSNTSDKSSSAIGKSDSDGMSIDSPIRHKDGEHRVPSMNSGDSEVHPVEGVNKLESSPQQRKGASKGKRSQLQSPPVSNRTRGNQTPNLQSTPELATKHSSTAIHNLDPPIPESTGQEDTQNPYLQRSPHICFNSNPEVLLGLLLPGDTPPGTSYPKLDLSVDEDAADWETRKRKELCYDMGTSAMSLTTLFTTPPRATDGRISSTTHHSVEGNGTQKACPHAPKVNRDTLKQIVSKNKVDGLLKNTVDDYTLVEVGGG